MLIVGAIILKYLYAEDLQTVFGTCSLLVLCSLEVIYFGLEIMNGMFGVNGIGMLLTVAIGSQILFVLLAAMIYDVWYTFK